MLYSMMLNALRKVKPTIPVSQVLLFCIAFGGLPLDAPAAIGGTLEAKDYLEFERVADPQISPDGQNNSLHTPVDRPARRPMAVRNLGSQDQLRRSPFPSEGFKS